MRLATILGAILVISIFLISATIQPWSDSNSIELGLEKNYSGVEGEVRVNYSLSGSIYSDPIRIILMPVDIYRSDTIFIFADKEKYSAEEYASVLGLYDHLRAEMDNLGIDRPVQLVDQPQVVQLLNGGPSTLIIVNSTQDWGDQSLAMMSWIEKGGQIFGIGRGALPFISPDNGHDRNSSSSGYFIRYEPLDYEGGAGVSASPIANALDLKYNSPRYGMRADDVKAYGLSIGYQYAREEELTSAALIHRGNGSIILFSDQMMQPFTTSMEDVVAEDIASMLASGLPWETGALFSYEVTGGANPTIGSFFANLTSSKVLVCYAFSTVDYQHRSRILVV